MKLTSLDNAADSKRIYELIDELSTKYATLTYLVEKLEVMVSAGHTWSQAKIRRSSVRHKESLPTYLTGESGNSFREPSMIASRMKS